MKKELKIILQQGEGFKIEFKESVGGLDKEIVAFANTKGGRVFLGVDDGGKIKSVNITNRLKSQIQDIARNCDPSIDVKLEKSEDILIIDIKEGKDKPYKCSSGFYLRQGANSQKMTRDEILDFAVGEGKTKFDIQLNENFNFTKDFDEEKLDLFLRKVGISKNLKVKQILANLDLGKFIGEKFYVNNACVLLFSKELSRIYYHTVVTCVRFKGNDRYKILDRKNFNKDILSNIEDSVNFVLQYLPLRYEIKGLRREEYYEIPEDAIREAVVNSIIHRDYFEKGANVQINIFDNRVEITNPGGLVAGLKKEDFGKRSISRNPLILSILSKTEFVEKVGSGINRMRKAMKEIGLRPPKFEFTNFFTVIFFRPKDNMKTSEKASEKTSEKILSLIKENSSTSAEDIANKIGKTSRAIEMQIAILKQKGLLKRIGSAKGGHWQICCVKE